MKAKKLRMRILVSFDAVIVVFSLLVALLGYYVIEKDIVERTQTKVKNDLNSASVIYDEATEDIKDVVRFTAQRFFIKDAISVNDREAMTRELGRIREAESLDILTLTDAFGKVVVRSSNPSVSGDSQAQDSLVRRVLSSGEVVAGTVIVPRDELMKESTDLAEQAHIKSIATQKAKPRTEGEETSGMMIKAAAAVLGYDGKLLGVLYGGNLLNRNYKIVDKVKETVYRGETYKGKDIGTATIFQGDLRISTNVRAEDRSRAVGTRVSAEVDEQVLVKGLPWVDRAFVVNHWYKTAYEPIKDIEDKTIGILYVGILEQPFTDRARNIFIVFLVIVSFATALAALLETVLTKSISGPVERMLKATQKLSEGDLGYEVEAETGTIELDALASSFNEMSERLRQRENSLEITNQKLAALNETYLDAVGFVSHELKGIVATTIMNAAAVRDGMFGAVTPQQKKALESATKTLEYLRETVRKFLDLSRIEKGELEFNRTEVRLREDVFGPCVETFAGEIAAKQMVVTNNITEGIKVNGDLNLLEIAANNLVGNAIKYGLEKGKVVLSCEDLGSRVRVEVYNDGRLITEQEKGRLFRKFSRLETVSGQKVKGTGLGLFITREIIRRHGGEIWVEPREKGNSFIFQMEKDFSPTTPF
jgi:two-component system NtrC family sensor kinase